MKIFLKYKALRFINQMTFKEKDDRFDYAMPLYAAWAAGARLQNLKKYDDIFECFFGINSFNDAIMQSVLSDIYNILWLYDDYMAFIKTESSKVFVNSVDFLLQLQAFNQGFSGYKFNPQTSTFKNINKLMEYLLYHSHSFDFKYRNYYEKEVIKLKKLVAKVEKYKIKYEKEKEAGLYDIN
jgi:hypothetical protein